MCRRQKRRDTGAIVGVVSDIAIGIRGALLDELGGLFCRHAKRNTVAIALGHLAAIQAGDLNNIGQDGIGQRKDLVVALVKATRQQARGFDMRQLVFTHGHYVAFAEENVARLMHGIGEQKPGELMAGCLLLGLNGGVALKLCLTDEAQKRQHELVECRNLRMGKDHRLCRVNACGHVIDDDVIDVVLDVGRGVAVCDDLVISDDDIGVDALFLKLNAALEGSKVMPDMQAARGPVAGEHRVLAGIDVKIRLNLVAALERCLEASLVCHVMNLSFSKINRQIISSVARMSGAIAYTAALDEPRRCLEGVNLFCGEVAPLPLRQAAQAQRAKDVAV